LPAAQTNSLRTQELDAPGHTPSESAQETTIRYNEPGELYGTDLHRDSTARLAEPEAYRTASLDNSETAELVGESETILPAAVPPVNNTSAPTPQVSQLTVAASSAREVRAAPTLSMMESYGQASETPLQFRWWHGAVLALVVLLFVGGLAFGGWYLWSHQRPAAQSTTESPSSSQGLVSEVPSATPTTASSPKVDTRTTLTADDEFRTLRDKRTKGDASDTRQIGAGLATAEKKYPNDYRFPYERAKLSIVGVTSHDKAFGALALAAERAISSGKAEEMLDELNADRDGDFHKLSHGHREWQTLQDALRNKDKDLLKALHH